MEGAQQQSAEITILYVEDDTDTRELLLSMLVARYPEHRFLTACNGLHGLTCFSEERPPIVLTDISMPGLDGLSMAAQIKTLAPETVVIAVTAHSATSHLLKAIEVGINQYLLKPLDYNRTCEVIDQAIATVRMKKQLQEQYEQISALNSELSNRTRELEGLNLELEAFNYTVAHDLRSPLVSISGYSQLLLDNLPAGLEKKFLDYIRVIHRQTIRMNSLIEALLNFSHYSRYQMHKEWTNLSQIANEIRCGLLLLEPERSVSFDITDNIYGSADKDLITVVLENLLGNAWKYSAKKSAARIAFGSISRGDDLVYFVRDNGIGFDQQDAERLFTPFQRLQSEEHFSGFGIGLATVARIIQRHGGKIWAEGEKGQGATFFFTLSEIGQGVCP